MASDDQDKKKNVSKSDKLPIGFIKDREPNTEFFNMVDDFLIELEFDLSNEEHRLLREIIQLHDFPIKSLPFILEDSFFEVKNDGIDGLDQIISFLQDTNHQNKQIIIEKLESFRGNLRESIKLLIETYEKERTNLSNVTSKTKVKIYCDSNIEIGQKVSDFLIGRIAPIQVEFISKLQLSWRGESPFDIKDIMNLPMEIEESPELCILLTNVPTSKVWQVRNYNVALISTNAFMMKHRIEDHHFYSYFIAILVLKKIQERENELELMKPPGAPHNLWVDISRGFIPTNIIRGLKLLALNNLILLFELVGIYRVVKSIKRKTSRISPVVDIEVVGSKNSAIVGATSEDTNPQDALGYKLYANAIGDLISHPDTKTPLNIGICAPWGQGKTVMQSLIKKRIDFNNKNGSINSIVIDFNPWKYTNSEQIWAEFYSTIVEGLLRKLKWYSEFWLWISLFWKTRPIRLLAITIPIILVVSLFVAYIINKESLSFLSYFISDTIIPTWVTFLTSIGIVIATIQQILTPATKLLFGNRKSKEFQQVLGIQKIVFDKFDFITSRIKSLVKTRIIVFVDDIDRCNPSSILQILEAIKLFFGTENFIFILAMDTRVVRLAISNEYKFMVNDNIENEELGRMYLEKIIQIPFHLPRLLGDDLIALKNMQLADIIEEEEHSNDGTKKNSVSSSKSEDKSIKHLQTSDKSQTENKESKRNEGDESENFKQDTESELSNSKIKLKISQLENSALDSMFKNDFIISPRLFIRLKNCYLLAKHFYLVKEKTPPSIALIKLLALSIKFPFASRKVFETIRIHKVDAFQELKITFEKDKQPKEKDVEDFLNYLKKFDISIGNVKVYEKYVSLFNLV